MGTTRFELHTAPKDYLNDAVVWIGGPSGKSLHAKRPIVRIAYHGKRVHCEALYADAYFLRAWDRDQDYPTTLSSALDKDLIFISAWYRRLLGITDRNVKIPGPIDLDVTELSSIHVLTLLWCYPRQHPQVLVLITSMLALIALGLGFIGTWVGLIALTRDTLVSNLVPLAHVGGWVCFVLGVISMGFGVVGLIRK